MSISCYNCGDEGKEGGCPVCGKDSKKLIVEKKDKEKFIKKAQFSQIPDWYIGVNWDKQILLDNHPDLTKDLRFHEYANRLESMYNYFLKGMIPPSSAFISAPSKMSKTILAYSCMQLAMSNKLRVTPFIDTIELKRLMTLGGDNPSWKLYKYIDYDDFLMCPVCFVTVTKLDKHVEAYTVILELMARRSRLGLPTFVLSKFTLKEISKGCVDSNYNLFIDNSAREDSFKYPAIIEYN